MATLEVILYVSDVDKSVAYYRDVLGFSVDFVMPDECGENVFAKVHRGGASLMFDAGNVISEAARSLLGAGLVLIIQDDDLDLDGYFAEVQSRGARIIETIGNRDWGDRNFSVKDPSGYTITFSTRISAATPTPTPTPAMSGL